MVAEKPAEIRVYGIIGVDVTSQMVAGQLDSANGRPIVVRINSRGGDVFDGVTILNSLRDYTGHVTTIVDGLAASAASFIAMGGDEVVMNRNSQMMIHNGHSQVAGGMDDLRKMADNLERINSNMASIYAEKAGGKAADWLAVMAVETWYSADEAVKAGLADRVEKVAERDGAAIAASIDLSIFRFPGRDHAPEPRRVTADYQPPTDSSAAPVEVTIGKEPIVATLNEGLAELFGIAADADDETILTAVKEALSASAEDAPVVTPAPTLEQASAIVASAGIATITTEALSALQEQAQAGVEARTQQVREADERKVDQAIVEGKIAPARRAHHLQALAADRDGHTAVLAALSPGLVPLGEIGHGATSEITNEDDAIYASLYGKGV